MMKIQSVLAVAALTCAMLASAVAVAGERMKISDPGQLKAGQCVYAGEVYEPGEMIVGKAKGITQVCAKVKDGGVIVTITQDSVDSLHLTAE